MSIRYKVRCTSCLKVKHVDEVTAKAGARCGECTAAMIVIAVAAKIRGHEEPDPPRRGQHAATIVRRGR